MSIVVVQMIPKLIQKEEAIKLRKTGLSYSEILKSVSVAKSTLSLWLRSVGLAKRHRQRLTQKKLESIKRGWKKWHQQRVDLVNKIKQEARSEIGQVSRRELWLMGAALYWAEGSKEREASIGQGLRFSNSDPLMIKLFIKWLKEILKIEDNDLVFELYIHENSMNTIQDAINYWAGVTKVPKGQFKYIYLKKKKIKTQRTNIGAKYFGLLRIRVRRSSGFNRKISGWIDGICENCGVV